MRPNNYVVPLYDMNAFVPHFGFSLKEKKPIDLEDAKKRASKIDSQLYGFGKIDPLVTPK